ncbi:hypothetical protein [Actinomadura nitritigenes]|uniref:hypothetical protein n=1 Tax=Actinomadura nitritigenes TaxID=134602 RepID=UPI003D922E6A
MKQTSGARSHVQIPCSLIYSPDHSGLAVWMWAMYEALMPHGLDGGRAPAIARRRFLAERAGSVLRRPRETSERYALVSAWTLDMVWARRRRLAAALNAPKPPPAAA